MAAGPWGKRREGRGQGWRGRFVGYFAQRSQRHRDHREDQGAAGCHRGAWFLLLRLRRLGYAVGCAAQPIGGGDDEAAFGGDVLVVAETGGEAGEVEGRPRWQGAWRFDGPLVAPAPG